MASVTKVLVVEDEVIVARNLANQLQGLGYEVVATASSGAKAIVQALATQPDIILMDIVLKGPIDGITAAQRIQEQMEVPIVYLSAYSDSETLARAQVSHPFGYLIKPCHERDLKVTLEIALYHHRTERSIRSQREQLDTLLRSMQEGVIATDNTGKVTFMNPMAETLTGWNSAEAIGQDVTQVFQLVNEVTGHPAVNPVHQALRESKVVYLEDYTSLIDRQGRRTPISDSAAPINAPAGEVSGVVVVFQDNSIRRHAELLEWALQKERQLSDLRAQFISKVSHEFRNPLSVILSSIDLLYLLEEEATPAQRQRCLSHIERAALEMNSLMEDVLLLGQSTSGKLTCRPQPLNLAAFAQEIVDSLAIAQGTTHPIQVSLAGDCELAVMDEQLLRYIISNLLSNAIKYSPEGCPIQWSITADIHSNAAIFCIEDQGIGIPESDQPYIFESFHRASNVGKIPGTGLGLAIVKQYVDLHCGSILCDSRIGIGTTFTVTLPLQLKAPIASPEAPSPAIESDG